MADDLEKTVRENKTYMLALSRVSYDQLIGRKQCCKSSSIGLLNPLN